MVTAMTTTSLDWRARAACRAVDADLFFPVADPGTPAYAAQAAEAQAVCAVCPVRVACREHALSAFEKHGVWGGMAEDERHLEQRRRQRRRREYAS